MRWRIFTIDGSNDDEFTESTEATNEYTDGISRQTDVWQNITLHLCFRFQL